MTNQEMINLIVFGTLATAFCGVMFWLAHNTNAYNRQQRELRKRQRRTHINSIRDNYQQGRNILFDVIRVDAQPDYTLYLEFENGERRVFDMTPLMDKKPFLRLKGSPLFMEAFVDYGTVVWPGNIDISPETLYDLSRPANIRTR